MNTTPLIVHSAFLVSIEVLNDRGLSIVLAERTGLGPEQDDPFGFGLKEREVVAGPTDATYKISWPVVVCFAVRGDPFPKGSVSTRTITEEPTDSAFMRWVKANSHAGADYVAAMAGEDENGRELRHWVVSSNEARFDVAALDPPTVEQIVA